MYRVSVSFPGGQTTQLSWQMIIATITATVDMGGWRCTMEYKYSDAPPTCDAGSLTYTRSSVT